MQAFVDGGVAEGRTIEYKQTLPGGRDEDKKEFLRDVTALANAVGGHILYGIAEEKGIAAATPGVESDDLDALILRLEGSLRDGVQPRIPNIEFGTVELTGGRRLVVLEVPQSFALPHMVTFKGENRFHLRHTAGKAPMTVDEIRAAFNLTNSTIERMGQFRRERLDLIACNEGPFYMTDGLPRYALHVLPFTMFDTTRGCRFRLLKEQAFAELRPLAARGWDFRYNFDGFVTFAPRESPTSSYAQFFRSGAVEAVTTEASITYPGEKVVRLDLGAIEGYVIRQLQGYLTMLGRLDVQPPYAIGLSLIGVRGAEIQLYRHDLRNFPRPMDRDRIVVPEMVIDRYDIEAAPEVRARLVSDAMRPAFDSIWNAGGMPASPYYGDDGRWSGPMG